MSKLTRYTQHDTVRRLAVAIASGLLTSVALNFFLTPAHVFQAGLTGAAQLISTFLQRFGIIHIDVTGWFNLLLNAPIAVLAWRKLGKKFTFYTILTVVIVSFGSILLPVYPLSDNPLMNSIFGGVLTGASVGIALKFGFSTGGLDVISMYLAKKTRITVGGFLFAINLAIVTIAGFGIQWESALYTIISIYCMTRVVDAIHTADQKLTVIIVTKHADEVIAAISAKLIRGITAIPSRGGYSGHQNTTLMVVITRYELYDLTQATLGVDPNAFIDLISTIGVFGEFLTSDQQAERRTSVQAPKNPL